MICLYSNIHIYIYIYIYRYVLQTKKRQFFDVHLYTCIYLYHNPNPTLTPTLTTEPHLRGNNNSPTQNHNKRRLICGRDVVHLFPTVVVTMSGDFPEGTNHSNRPSSKPNTARITTTSATPWQVVRRLGVLINNNNRTKGEGIHRIREGWR